MNDHETLQMTVTVLALTANGDDPGTPAFALGLGDSSVGRSIADGLRSAGVPEPRVLTRPGWEAAARDAFGKRATIVAVASHHDALAHTGDRQDASGCQLIVPGNVSVPAYLLRSLVRFPSSSPAVLLLDDGADGTGLGVTVVDGLLGGFASEDATSGIVWLPQGSRSTTTPAQSAPVDRSRAPGSSEHGDDLAVGAGIVAALLRAGTPVRAVSPRHGTVDLIVDAEGADRYVDRRAARLPDEDARMHDAVKAWDGWFTTFFVSPYTRYVARWLGRRDVAPNTVTAASLVTALGAAALVLLDRTLPMIVAAMLLQVSFALDCVDGQLARYSARFSTAGAWFDIASDRVKEFAVMVALAVTVGSTSAWLAVSAAISVQTVRHLANVAFGRRSSATTLVGSDRSIIAAIARRDRDRPQAGLLFWLRRVATFSIGERLALLSLGMLIGIAEPILWAYLGSVTVASALQIVGRRRRPGQSPRLTALDLDLMLPIGSKQPLAGADSALLATTLAAVSVVTWTSLDVVALGIWAILAIALALRTRPRSASIVAAVDFATVIFLIVTVEATWQLGAVAAVTAVAWADRGYWDDYSATAPRASAYLRLGLIGRQAVMLVGATRDEVEIAAIGVAALVGLSVVWGWVVAGRQLSGSRARDEAAVSLIRRRESA